MNIRHLFGRALSGWVTFWRRIEGPELEPPIWHSHYLSYRVTRDVLAALGQRLQGPIIDIGVGTGHGENYLDPNHTTYYPTDLPTGRDASDTYISRKGKVPIHHCSVYERPFTENHFGGAMLMVLEHLQWPQKGLTELFRVLQPGALVLLSTPFAFPVLGAPYDYRRWTPDGLQAESNAASFEIENVVACGGTFSSTTINLHLALRFHTANSGSYLVPKLVALLFPMILIGQGVSNLLALCLDRLDKSGAFPLAVVALARKPKIDI